ncbi:PHD finger protein ALFIN-LIKE 3 [Helianthus annuus]|uniref:PHD finger protein ALFIN-LIKE 3 n=1 Tax=Helianthus annuus TaxID=4232 RepID=UPI000B90364F|nr:PHD finger protein ALFIN-LIKE 3 [Helianthus annuus]
MEAASSPRNPTTIEEIFRDYSACCAGLVRALTHDADTFFALCDPDKDNLCLYGYPNGSWEVTLPTENVPSDIPDPVLGINFARDDMDRKDWLLAVAIHNDSWLISMAFFYASWLSLNAADRNCLFTSINNLPTVYEDVKEWLVVQDKSSEASGSRSRIPQKRSSDGQSKSTSNMVEESHAENEEEHKVTLCGSCGEVYYNGDEFWIACDFCQLWYHGKCVSVTPTMAEKIHKYKCPSCTLKRTKQ